MSKSNSKTQKKVQMPSDRAYYVMSSHSSSNKVKESIIIIPISEDEEQKLDRGGLHAIRDNQEFYILSKNVICYGEIDFSNSSEDMNTIANMNWLDYLGLQGVTVPSDYDYEEHCCYPPGKYIRFYDTTNPAIVARYAHACLGKPKRCCIFRQYT